MTRMKAGLRITLLAPAIRLGGPPLSVAAGNSPSTDAQPVSKCLRGQSRCNNIVILQVQPDLAGLQHYIHPVLTFCLVFADHASQAMAVVN